MSLPLTEKTLELNVVANMLEDVRTRFSSRAYAYGYSLTHESTTGLDSSLQLPSGARFLSLQFKRPYRTRGPDYVFQFNNNTQRNQHNLVWQASVRYSPPISVFYALPCFQDMAEVLVASPDFRNNTMFLDPFWVMPINDMKVHRFHVNPTTLTTTVHSSGHGKSIPLLSWKEVIDEFGREALGTLAEVAVSKLRSSSPKEENLRIYLGERKTRVQLRALVIPP